MVAVLLLKHVYLEQFDVALDASLEGLMKMIWLCCLILSIGCVSYEGWE